MTLEHNVFANPPESLTSDDALAALRKRLSPKEDYYCGTHLLTMLDSNYRKNFTVGSTRRFTTDQECNICDENALFVVTN
jgi:hypothetical protein